MGRRLLVAFGTLTGTTRETAEAIGAELRAAGHTVDVKRADELRRVEGYDAAVLGTPVMAGRLHGALPRLMRRSRRELARIPVALFVTCGAMIDPTEQNRRMAEGYLTKAKALAPEVVPVDTVLFAGGLKTEGDDFRRVNFVMKAMVRAVAKKLKDARDVEAVRVWAQALPAKLFAGARN